MIEVYFEYVYTSTQIMHLNVSCPNEGISDVMQNK